MANKPTSEESTADVVTDVVPESRPVVVARQTSGVTRWVFTSIAGVGLVVMGLLGGILIGQHSGFEAARDQAKNLVVEHQDFQKLDKLQEKLREHMQNRQGNHQGQQLPPGQNGQDPNGQPNPQPSPSQTIPGSNG